MIWGHKAFLAVLACMFVGGCSSLGKAPDLVDQLASADLSARGQQPTPSRTEFASDDRSADAGAEFPGSDQTVARRAEVKGIAKGNNGYELNFSDAGLADLTKVILTDTLQIPFVYDPRVQGTVTLSTGGPVSRAELLTILETVLAMNRGALIAEGPAYRIVPATGGRAPGANVDYVAERRRIGPGFGVAILPLKFISADTMIRMLGSFAGDENAVQANVHKNLLILRGSSQERQSLIDVATMFDVDWMKGQSAGIYVLKSAAPSEIINELQEVFQAEGQGSGLIKFQPVNRLNAVLVLTQKKALLENAGKWIARLDRSSAEGDSFYVYRVENGKAKDLAKMLNAMFGSGNGGTVRAAEETEVAPNKAATRIGTSDNGSLGAASGGGDPQHGQSPQRSALAGGDAASGYPQPDGEAAFSAENVSSGAIRIVPDDINNKLLIRAPGRTYRKILGVLNRIDRAPLQVLINATLAEVTLNDSLEYGVQVFLEKRKGRYGALGFSTGSTMGIAPTLPGLNFVLGSAANSPQLIIDAIASETNVRVVSSPSVVVLHNQTATLQVGDEVPIATRQIANATESNAPLINEIKFRDTGVILKVTPRINTNGLVTMDIEQEISSVVNSTTSGEGGTLTPTISQRRISSMIAVQHGQMVVLGGLISEQVDKEKSRVPGLQKIPYLGDIIGDNSSKKVRKELIVFLQPKIIAGSGDASHAAEELRSRMQFLAPSNGAPGGRQEAAQFK
ncbi:MULTISPECIES: type II secretion system secretin GspD [Rhodomicrobium]|uniref:type II secretion system secretin GspD n=1 Tax=Rhodomicrobium TaxID=1068 RepID=UPI0014827421|nr:MULTISPECIES: type II secretion system secretin GspD [Rhodomicrobium]